MPKTRIFQGAEDFQGYILREVSAEFGAKIFDLSDFLENTIYCGGCCNKIAYMVK